MIRTVKTVKANGAHPNGVRPIEKVPTGIPGFDELTGGGLPRGRATLVVGGPGSGKTLFGLQTLVNGLRRRGESGILVAFEEQSVQLHAYAAALGWRLSPSERKRLFLLDARLSPAVVQQGAFDLLGLLATLQAKAAAMGARRIVFDGIDVLLSVLDDPVAEQREIYRLHEWLSASGLTGILTAKADPTDPLLLARYAFMPYMADCVIHLHQRLIGRTALRELRILKYRGAGPSSNEFPFLITHEGIKVGYDGEAAMESRAFTGRISTGVDRLDKMLGGGFFRGSSILISGAPGTAKSTLAAKFAEAACRRGDRTLYVSFDEAAAPMVRNMASVGINLSPHVRSGILRMEGLSARAQQPEEHLFRIRSLWRDHRSQCLVLDPVSALVSSVGMESARDAALRLLDEARQENMTVFSTSLVKGSEALEEMAVVELSTLADAWIHLSYVAQHGERNRALTIVKSRGMKHSNQVRELILSDRGVALADVDIAGGEVVMGTVRWQREAHDRAGRLQAKRGAERARREHELALNELQAHIETLKRKAVWRQAELVHLAEDRAEQTDVRAADTAGALARRGADKNGVATAARGPGRARGAQGAARPAAGRGR